MPYAGDNMSSVRRGNRAAVLRCLHAMGPLSRKRLAQQLGLTPAAITKIVSELIADGLLLEGAALPGAGAGRREVTLALESEACCALGVFLGLGGAILSGVRLSGEVAFSETVSIPLRAPAEETTRLLARRLLALEEEKCISRSAVVGLGIAVRGTLSPDGRGVLSSFDALDTENYPICARFEAETGLKSILSNNVRALLAAQNFLDRDHAADSCFFLRCGTGIGAALSIHGKVWEGSSRQCAEIGHIPVVRQGGKPCHCGKSGCLETIASPAALREEALARMTPERSPLLWQLAQEKGAEAVTVRDVLDAARGGDAGAAAAADRAAETLAGALKSVIYLLDPGRLVLYGPIFDHPYFLSRLTAEMELGVDAAHAVTMEKSRYNGKLESVAAGLLAAERFLENGGIV